MKIIHTSDWHLGISLHSASLIEEQRNFIDYLIKVVKENSVDAILIAGDIFDNSVSSAEAITIYNYAVTTLCNEIGVPVIISAGNHDGAARLASCNELLKKSGLYISGKLTKDIVPITINDCNIYPLPYFNIDEVKALFPDEKISDYNDAMNYVIKNILKNTQSDKKNILMCHCFVGGSVLSESDRSAMVGSASIVSEKIFEDFDYVAMGHLHRSQKRGKNIRYSGSPLKYSFSEANHKKNITIIDIDDEVSIQEIEVVPLREVRVIKGTFDEVVDIAEKDTRKDDYIKIEISDKYAGMESVELFRSFYSNLLSISGKVNETQENELTVDELHNLSIDDILGKFYKEITGTDISEEQVNWFNEALESVQEGDGNQ
ncbi:exonuclease SbcCD subunit D [Sedimentibacter sp. MB31-C6]|uniref:exonuclease SbcCD subunit D n=1 Tax=Sedimentibacter sp. MB31-C6 TaxID=3109366 RepID=UPI002DDCF4E4|nr:exonuclease SbcCD subunit D [Sedimentibacter sp. MB36-C1]WSI03514.1 exonuclease SbcCD subunit D [Sedimentibacter sp. MB36-C1]